MHDAVTSNIDHLENIVPWIVQIFPMLMYFNVNYEKLLLLISTLTFIRKKSLSTRKLLKSVVVQIIQNSNFHFKTGSLINDN